MMASLKKIIVQNFRNIAFAELPFCPGINCICGRNGQGKTNLLDAIHYLSITRSALNTPDSFCCRHGSDSFSIAGEYLMHDGTVSRFVVSTGRDSKTVKRDDKVCRKLSEHIGLLPVVMVSPQDSSLVSDSGEERRRFVNTVLSQMDRDYLAALQRYNRLLAQRNRMLKDAAPDRSLFEIIDSQMGEAGSAVMQRRRSFAEELGKAVASYYSLLSGGAETVAVTYRPDIAAGDDASSVTAALENGLEKDVIFKYTTSGIQRDDFLFSMGGQPIRRCGSQGQQKSFLVALKLAQYDIMKAAYGFPPILLLDDVFDKLDFERTANLIRIVSSSPYGQIFITDTNRERLEQAVGGITSEATYITACNGEF